MSREISYSWLLRYWGKRQSRAPAKKCTLQLGKHGVSSSRVQKYALSRGDGFCIYFKDKQTIPTNRLPSIRARTVTQVSLFGRNVFGQNRILAEYVWAKCQGIAKRADSNPNQFNQNHNNPIKTRGQSSQLPLQNPAVSLPSHAFYDMQLQKITIRNLLF